MVAWEFANRKKWMAVHNVTWESIIHTLHRSIWHSCVTEWWNWPSLNLKRKATAHPISLWSRNLMPPGKTIGKRAREGYLLNTSCSLVWSFLPSRHGINKGPFKKKTCCPRGLDSHSVEGGISKVWRRGFQCILKIPRQVCRKIKG